MDYCFYETTNLVNGKKYLGIHGSEDLTNDPYIGSGTLLQEAIRKYGRENFVRKDLKIFQTSQEARIWESEHITPKILKSPDYYNIAPGGGGGVKGARPYYVNKKRYLVDPLAVSKFLEEHPNATEEVPEEIRERSRQFNLGRITVNNGIEHKNVKPEELDEYIKDGWNVGVTEDLKERNSRSKVGIKVMHLGDKARHVRLVDVPKFLAEEYEFGPAEWMNELQGSRHKGLVKVHKGLEIKFISRDKLAGYLADGWIKGSSPRERQVRREKKLGRRTIYRGSEEKSVWEHELEGYFRDGWVLGRNPETTQKIRNNRNPKTGDRIKEEAESRKLIYTKSQEYLTWWEQQDKNSISRIHFGVHKFLKEKGMTKEQYLNEMKERGEI